MKIACNLDKSKQGEVLSEFQTYLSADEEDTIRGLFPQYLFFYNASGDDSGYGDDTPVRVCYTTCCQRSFEGVRANYARGKIHNEKVTCPYCGKTLTGKAMYKYRYEMPTLTSWVKTAVACPAPDGGLLIEAGNARRSFNWDDLRGEIDWRPLKRYYFNRGTVQMWDRGFDGENFKWRPEQSVKEPFAPNMMGHCYYIGDYNIVGLAEALNNSSFKYCQIAPYYSDYIGADIEDMRCARWIVKYLALYALHPQIEIAVKFGLYEAVRQLVEDGKKNARLLNWDGATPADFLRMSKEDARSFLRYEMDLQDLRNWKETAGKIKLGHYLSLADSVGGTGRLREIAACAKKAGVGLEKAVRYAKSHADTGDIGRAVSTWKDYLDLAAQLHYDLKEQTVAMPKDLTQRHDIAAQLIRHQANEAELKRYKKRRRMLEKKYAYSNSGLSILVPMGSEEIVKEGQTLHHCVGGYAKRHVDGAVTILFLRKSRTPGRSFLTIELYEDKGQIKIKQIHGYRNEGYGNSKEVMPPIKKYDWFLTPWLAWVNSGSERDKEGRPIMPAAKEVKSA